MNEPQAGWLAEKYGVFENSDELTKAAYPYAVMRIDIPYLDWDEDQRKMTNAVVRAEDWIEVTSDTRTLTDGVWYVVRGDVIFPDGNLTVQGSAHLILCDGSSLTIKNPGDGKAAVVLLEGTRLAIYGQTEGSGSLTLLGGNYGAGIGGGREGAGGTVTVNGGRVTATGGYRGAGIGGGFERAGGIVTINGGSVTAAGGDSGAGIGSGASGSGGRVTITGGRITAEGGDGAEDIGSGWNASSPCAVAISGGIFAREPQAAWLVSGYAVVENPDAATKAAYPWAIADPFPRVTPDAPLGPFGTAAEATNAMATAVFAPRAEVACVLTHGAARSRYAEWFRLDVTSKDADEWVVEAMLTEAAKSNLVETATAATRQIPVAAITALADEATTDIVVRNCEPGFYYTLYGGQGLTALPETGTAYGPTLCGADGKVTFDAVAKPSDAAGFFTIGVSATKGE